jgi:peroxiredoxin
MKKGKISISLTSLSKRELYYLHTPRLRRQDVLNKYGPSNQINEACGFRDVFEKVSAKEYLIYGISTDAPKANKNFKEKQGLQYHLLSDQKSELLRALGATKEGNKTLRSTWVIGKGGIIEDVQLGSSPGDSVSKSLKKLGIEA